MKSKFTRTLAIEYILKGNPITEFEGCVLFGSPSIHKLVSEMRRKGHIFHSKFVTYAEIKRRINKYMKMEHPKDLPINEITFMQHQLSDIKTLDYSEVNAND